MQFIPRDEACVLKNCAMQKKFFKGIFPIRMSMSIKLTFALGAIAVILLLSSIISIMEYRRMSDYVSNLIASNINCINIAQRLSNECDSYNLQLLAIVGEHDPAMIPKIDCNAFLKEYDQLKNTLNSSEAVSRADSVIYAYSAYMLTSLEFEKVIVNDFIDNRDWYFKRLQPKYQRLKADIEKLNDVIYLQLKENSQTFQDGFYRSIIPGVVSVGAGLLLVLLLLMFILIYYIRPLKKMLSGIDEYQTSGRRYGYEFEGDDELVHLNSDLTDLIEENVELKKRVGKLREEREKLIETSSAAQEL